MNPMRRLRSPARSFSLSFVVSITIEANWPLVGRSRQPSIFNSVDFPEPDGPVIDKPFAAPHHEVDINQRINGGIGPELLAHLPQVEHMIGIGGNRLRSATLAVWSAVSVISSPLAPLSCSHHHHLAGREPLIGRVNLDIATRRKPWLHGDVFLPAAAIDQHARRSVGGKRHRAGRHGDNRALRWFRSGLTDGRRNLARSTGVALHLDPEIEVVAIHAARAGCVRHRLNDAVRLDAKRLLVDRATFIPGFTSGAASIGSCESMLSSLSVTLITGPEAHCRQPTAVTS